MGDEGRILKVIKIALAITGLLGFVSLGAARVFSEGWQLQERLGTVLLTRTDFPVLQEGSSDLCPDNPRIEYIHTEAFGLPEEPSSDSPEWRSWNVMRKGLFAVRPLHIWGELSDIGCKEPLGWGTAFLVGFYKRTSIWVTVEHNV